MKRDPNELKGRRQEFACTFTAVPENSSVKLGQLLEFDPVRYMAAFRQHLYRVMATMPMQADGVLFACLHGAYDPTTQTYPIHIHGAANRGMISVVDGLRNLKKYEPAQQWDGRDAANTPVVMSRGLLTNMPDPLTYIIKRFWPLRTTYMDQDGLRKAYPWGVQRFPEPAHSEYLLFLDRYRLEDITLLMGMQATQHGLVAR